jgi:CheY-like chemotaxis protein
MNDALSNAAEDGRSTPIPGEVSPVGEEITVLVVDDEPSNQTSLAKIFQREGMRVFTAEGAKAALEVARKHKVQVVLTDLMMPGTNGVELMRALKEVSPDTETVLMTA